MYAGFRLPIRLPISMQLKPSDSSPAEPVVLTHDPYTAIRDANFRRYWLGNTVAIFGLQMQAATVEWEIFNRTGKPLYIGLVGLVQVVPVLSLTLLAGHVADQVDRKRVVMAAVGMLALAAMGLAAVSWFQLPVPMMFVCLAFVGVARAF